MSVELNEQKLLSLLSPNRATSIKTLAQRLYVSEPTARRYVNSLAAEGRVIRTHGGCMPSAASLDLNDPLSVRLAAEQEEKQLIAQRAAELVSPSDTVFLDSSTTAYHLLPYLSRVQGLTVVTSGIKTAAAAAELNLRTVCLGGIIHSPNLSSNSALAAEMIARFNADLFFFSCDALSEDGRLTDQSLEECHLRQVFMKHANRSVLLLGSSKRGKLCRYNLCHLRDLHAAFTVQNGEAVLLEH
jgi:DeoR/GlpR family transcriptional regulator of sugar metabolism